MNNNYPETRKRYYLNNKEKLDKRRKEYYLENIEKIKEYTKKYYQETKERKKYLLNLRKDTETFIKQRSGYNKKYRMNNKEKLKEYYILNKEKIKLRTRVNNYKTQFGIDIDTYNIMLEEQNGCCAICGISILKLKKNFSVDHCHSSLKVRGLLCSKCNTVLGFVNDDINILKNCISYLKKYKDGQ